MDTKEMPLVSVVVPVYNAEKYIARCIESILAQTYDRLELVLVNDGSPDKSGVICDEYGRKDTRIKVIHTENHGVSHARNTGMDNANGEYLIFVDSDDWVSPDYVRDLLPVEGEDLVHCGYIRVVDGKEENCCFYKEHIAEGLQWTENFPVSGPVLAPWANCYKRAITESQHIRFDTTIDIGEDELFNMEYLSYCSKIRFSENCDYFYTINKTGSLITRHHACRTLSAIKAVQARERVTQKNEYYARWYQWRMAIAHHRKWLKSSKGAKRKTIGRCLRDCYRTAYFRESIPFMRKNGTLDEKVETFFMHRILHPLYPGFYKLLVAISRIKRHG